MTPANVPEETAAPELHADMKRQKLRIAELSIDRAYINSEMVEDVQDVQADGRAVLCKPWSGRNSRVDLFGKSDFKLDTRRKTITCPAGQVEVFEPGEVVPSTPRAAAHVPYASSAHTQRPLAVPSESARTNNSSKRLRKLSSTARLRARTAIEHRLAHIAARKGPKARYRGPGKISWNYDAPPRSRTSRPSSAEPRDDSGFILFGALAGC